MNGSLKDQLEEMKDLFESVAISCASIILQKKARVAYPWKVIEHFNGNFSHHVSMGCVNSDFKSLILFGFNQESIFRLVNHSDGDIEYAFDAFCEFVNTYCAFLDDSSRYTEIFGKQIQEPPMVYCGDAPFVSFKLGIEGTIQIGEDEIYMGYVIQDNNDAVTGVNRG